MEEPPREPRTVRNGRKQRNEITAERGLGDEEVWVGRSRPERVQTVSGRRLWKENERGAVYCACRIERDRGLAARCWIQEQCVDATKCSGLTV
jgi:hypothetical protein